ncbi:MAG: hypothetical protein IJ630_12405 [Treponema sp.]|nr:hypothetical protein [Treponema sp.]
MKRILTFAVIYLASIFLGMVIFATLFMLNCNLTSFVTGVQSAFFSLKFFMTGLFFSVPLVCILVQILFIFYLIRHPSQQILSFILYVIFGAVSWLVLIPTDLHLIHKYDSDTYSSRVEASSAGVFRKEASGVFYYSRIDENGKAEGLFLDTTGYFGQEGAVVPLYDYTVKTESAFPYSDILIKNSLEPSKIVTYPLSVYNALLTAALYSSSLGFLAWLAFASLGLALLSVYGVQFASSWKLANVIFVICSCIAILFINFLYYMNIMPDFFKEIAFKLSELTGVKDPLIILINLIITAVFAVFGLFMSLYRFGNSNSEIEE